MKITTQHIELKPEQFLLHLQPVPSQSYYKSLAMIMINAANMCIPRCLGTPKVPSILEWYKQINKKAEMEQFIAIARLPL